MAVIVTTEWLRDFVEFDLGPDELAEKLSSIGLAVDAIEPLAGHKGEHVLELEVTSNRGDCWSVLGVARELAAALGREVKPLELCELTEGKPADVEVAAPDLCPRYTARVIRDVKIGPSPEWMQKRLDAVGIRPISNVVDITNYVLVEMGQPLHAFDMSLLAGGKIVVRRAEQGEEIDLLDETTRELGADDLVIADAERPVALAGVMGGANTEICASTEAVLLESAQFNQVSTRKTRKSLGVETESSVRFEHGVDPVGVELASRRAAFLLAKYAGGEIVPGVTDTNPDPYRPEEIALRHVRLTKLLGGAIPDDEIVRILEALGLALVREEDADGGKVTVWSAPSWRQDLGIEADLIEEVARIHGYDRLPGQATMRVFPVKPHAAFDARRKARDVLTGLGYTEVVGASFFSEDIATFGGYWSGAYLQARPPADVTVWEGGGAPLLVSNPVRRNESGLRTSLIPSLLAAKRANQNRDDRVHLFEVAPVCLRSSREQRERLAILDDGFGETEVARADSTPEETLRRVRGAIEAVAKGLGCEAALFLTPSGGHRTRDLEETYEVHCGSLPKSSRLGIVGLLSDHTAELWDIRQRPALLEIDLGVLLQASCRVPQANPLPVYHSITRDVALVVEEGSSWEDVVRVVHMLGNPLRHDRGFRLLSVYRGPQTGPGMKSLAFRVEYRAPDRTLTDEDVKPVHDEFVASLCTQLRARIRE